MKKALSYIKNITKPINKTVKKQKNFSTEKSLAKTRKQKRKNNKKPTQEELKIKKEKLEKELNRIKSLMSSGSSSKTVITLTPNKRK